ncbi:phytase [Lacimicrobium alkaliphilum]|uniref:Hydrolase n=1 Tax=Lacimicrobium alkaliphilum TaxID=1526571 RepID=A0ABQ1RJ31_9ALTE|nr:phytase [Lacimicrobium alkaliphilum]GGD69947.1 hydrolase [Lacimicrobium alkaliphilum]
MFTLKSVSHSILAISCLLPATVYADTRNEIAEVTPVVETRDHFDDLKGKYTDVDDPAIWIHPTTKANSLVITTLKQGGLDIYDLDGNLMQFIKPAPAPGCEPGSFDCNNKGGRFNNVDIIYDFDLNGKKTDIAIASDRGLDKLAIYTIDISADGQAVLNDVTDTDVPLLFTRNQKEVNEGSTAYGLTAIQTDKPMAFVTQNATTRVEQVELFDTDNGHIGYRKMATMTFPHTFPMDDGSEWTPCSDDDGERPHFEGMVADPEHNALYLAQEDVGIWRVKLDNPTQQSSWNLFARVRKFGVPYSRTWLPGEEEYACDFNFSKGKEQQRHNLWEDVEGLTLYNAGDGKGYILASSQGNNTFALYDREDQNDFVDSFTVAGGDIDAVEETDGLMVVNVNLGAKYPQGLLVMQDGQNIYNQAQKGAERESSNFKYVSWKDVAEKLNLNVSTKDMTRH